MDTREKCGISEIKVARKREGVDVKNEKKRAKA